MYVGLLTCKEKTAIAPGLALKLTLNLAKQSRENQASDRGLTLIEGLIAIVVVSITVISITPPIFWATASRVQTRRAEQALQLAQGEIDRVRALIDRNDIKTSNVGDLPPSRAGFNEEQVRNQAPAPTTEKTSKVITNAKIGQCTAVGKERDDDVRATIPEEINQFLRVDVDADCKEDFLVQIFRSEGLDATGQPVTASTVPAGFVMGVRVYSFVAEKNLKDGRGQVEAASLRGTTGQGNQELRPLAVLYSTIVASNTSGNADLYRKLCPLDAAKPKC
jgi:type II secretory pathway pseudopilin PulG